MLFKRFGVYQHVVDVDDTELPPEPPESFVLRSLKGRISVTQTKKHDIVLLQPILRYKRRFLCRFWRQEFASYRGRGLKLQKN